MPELTEGIRFGKSPRMNWRVGSVRDTYFAWRPDYNNDGDDDPEWMYDPLKVSRHCARLHKTPFTKEDAKRMADKMNAKQKGVDDA